MDFIDEIELPEQKLAYLRSFKTFGPEWIEKAIRVEKAREYLDSALMVTARDSCSVGRCCSEGYITFARKDGENITDDDIMAILTIERGQENRLTARTEKTASIYWLCDSSD